MVGTLRILLAALTISSPVWRVWRVTVAFHYLLRRGAVEIAAASPVRCSGGWVATSAPGDRLLSPSFQLSGPMLNGEASQ
jgi:glucose dehydrogenase